MCLPTTFLPGHPPSRESHTWSAVVLLQLHGKTNAGHASADNQGISVHRHDDSNELLSSTFTDPIFLIQLHQIQLIGGQSPFILCLPTDPNQPLPVPVNRHTFYPG